MHLSQSALFWLCCASFFAGILLSFLCDFLYAMRLWLLPSKSRYTILSIQKLRALCIKKRTKENKKGFQIAIFFGDILLCLASALMLVLLLYWLNNGAFRAAAPFCMALGFYLCHISISKGVRLAFQWVVFAIESFIYMLLRPFQRLFAIVLAKFQKNARKRYQKRLTKQRQIYTKQAIQNIEKSVERLLPIYSKSRMQKGDNRARKSKKAI